MPSPVAIGSGGLPAQSTSTLTTTPLPSFSDAVVHAVPELSCSDEPASTPMTSSGYQASGGLPSSPSTTSMSRTPVSSTAAALAARWWPLPAPWLSTRQVMLLQGLLRQAPLCQVSNFQHLLTVCLSIALWMSLLVRFQMQVPILSSLMPFRNLLRCTDYNLRELSQLAAHTPTKNIEESRDKASYVKKSCEHDQAPQKSLYQLHIPEYSWEHFGFK